MAPMGPEPYGSPSKRARKPEWVRILEEDVDNDPAIANLMEGTNGDPDRIREKMKFALKDQDLQREGQGSVVPPQISFRSVSPSGLWVWLEFLEAPLSGEREMLEGVLKSWFAVGKLGGYNSSNLQVYENADDDQSYFDYDNDELAAGESHMASYVHDIREVEYQETWARVWIDLGTADELAIDVLLNMLVGFSHEMVGLKSIRLGGTNEDWPVPEEDVSLWGDAEADYMKVGMNPMKVPEGLDEEFQFMDEEGMLEGAKRKARGGGVASSSSASTGYSVQSGTYGATAEERELQQLAAKLRRREPAASAAPAGAAGGRRRVGGARGGPYYPPAAAPDGNGEQDVGIDPDDYEFVEDDIGGMFDGSSGRAGAQGGGSGSGSGGQEAKRPWGASFIRRVNRGTEGRSQP